jgi:hypothetical protein
LAWRLSARHAGRILEKRFFTPCKHVPPFQEKEVLQAGKPFQFHIHGKRIQAWRWGTGAGILFVHGWNGRGGQFHHFIPKVVEEGFSAIAFDAPAQEIDVHGIVGHSLGAAAVVQALSSSPVRPQTVLLAPALKLAAILERGLKKGGFHLWCIKGSSATLSTGMAMISQEMTRIG